LSEEERRLAILSEKRRKRGFVEKVELLLERLVGTRKKKSTPQIRGSILSTTKIATREKKL